jgi:hypothetical protein
MGDQKELRGFSDRCFFDADVCWCDYKKVVEAIVCSTLQII